MQMELRTPVMSTWGRVRVLSSPTPSHPFSKLCIKANDKWTSWYSGVNLRSESIRFVVHNVLLDGQWRDDEPNGTGLNRGSGTGPREQNQSWIRRFRGPFVFFGHRPSPTHHHQLDSFKSFYSRSGLTNRSLLCRCCADPSVLLTGISWSTTIANL